ncbi:MAG: FtsB family cell division protein [Microgenomates group bacterium]
MKWVKKVVLIFLILFFSSSLLKNIINYRSKLQFYQDYKREYEEEKKRQQKLKTEIARKKSLTELEKTIRNKLNLAKEGEFVILLPSPTSHPPTPTPSSSANWLKWWRVFFK